jgi:hypothetical protein
VPSPVDLLVQPAFGEADIQATPSSGGLYRLPLLPTVFNMRAADEYFVTPSGLVRVQAEAPGLSDPLFEQRPPVNYVKKAQRRINELKGAPSPWDSASATHGGASATPAGGTTGAHEIAVSVEDEPHVVVSPNAEAAALHIFGQFTLLPPSSSVAIFPKEDHGLRLQTVGEERTVIVDISAAGHEFVCEYAGDNVFHTQRMWDAAEAALFVVDSTR